MARPRLRLRSTRRLRARTPREDRRTPRLNGIFVRIGACVALFVTAVARIAVANRPGLRLSQGQNLSVDAGLHFPHPNPS